MRIASSSVQLTSSHVAQRVTTRAATFAREVTAAPAGGGQGRGVAAHASSRPAAAGDLTSLDAVELLILLRFFKLAPGKLGRDALRAAFEARGEAAGAAASLAAAAPPAPAARGWSVRLDVVETTVEAEASAFQASGQVTTADGRTLDLALETVRQRAETRTRELHLQAGDAPRGVDPLVLDLDGAPARFAGTTAFDLDGDGAAEQVASLAPGAAYLALDRDGDGQIGSGRELFGPSTGSGFGELRALDADGNGWVDEADPDFERLALWNPTTGQLGSLRAAGVGALYTGAASTPFEVKGEDGAVQARVAETGLFLKEDGGAGALEHVDLVV